ncbi:MAG: hypothetical protein LBS25_09060 [Candidatus Symbiothrix sp.]|jgi:hypothetical protein|nr:hypothetical protein [Candidatus Symbiothrix sp.]
MKKIYFSRVLALCVLGITTAVSAFSETSIVIEAENADVFHFASTSARGNFSNGTGVDMKSTTNSYVRYNNVNVTAEGVYNLAVAYATMNVRCCYLQVNNQKPSLLTFTESTSDWNTSDKSLNTLIYLEAGDNVIELGAYEYNGTQHAPAIDKLTITDSEEIFAKPADRITPVVVQAETFASKTGNANASARSGFADGNGANVGDGEQKHGSLTYENVNVSEAGTYDLTWYYASMGTRGIYIKVNNQKPIKSVLLENSNSWGDTTPADEAGENGENAHSTSAPRTLAKTEQVYLEAGDNTIVLASLTTFVADNGPNIDRFVIKSSPKTVAKQPEQSPNTYVTDYTDIRTGATVDKYTTQENLNKLFDNDETTFFTATEATTIEIELPYPIIATSFTLALGENYDKSNVSVDYYRLASNYCTECPRWESLEGDNLNANGGRTQPEFTRTTVSDYTLWLGPGQKDRAAQKFRITLTGDNISVGEFQINGFPYVGPYSEDTYFPEDLTIDAGAWSSDQKGWNADNSGNGGEGYARLHDRKPYDQSSSYTAESNKCYIEFSFDTPTEVGAYSICNRPDQYDRNPRNWRLYGYAEGQADNAGTLIDEQYGVRFIANSSDKYYLQNLVFKIANPAIYKRYRLYITQTYNSGGNVDASEIQFLAAYPAPADVIPFTSGELIIPANESKSASDYISEGLAGLVFNEGSEFSNADNLTVYGTTKVVKTFDTNKWYPIGFPFDIASINVEYGSESKPGIIYNGSGTITAGVAPTDGNADDANIYAATYDGDVFAYAGTSTLEAGEAYIIEFPKADFDEAESVRVTFATEAGTVLNTTGNNPSISEYTLVANPDLENKDDLGVSYYYVLNAAHTVFEKTTTLGTSLQPFDAVIASTEGSKVSVGIDVATALPAITKDPVVGKEYYNLQGVRISNIGAKQPVIVKETLKSGNVVSKVVINH